MRKAFGSGWFDVAFWAAAIVLWIYGAFRWNAQHDVFLVVCAVGMTVLAFRQLFFRLRLARAVQN